MKPWSLETEVEIVAMDTFVYLLFRNPRTTGAAYDIWVSSDACRRVEATKPCSCPCFNPNQTYFSTRCRGSLPPSATRIVPLCHPQHHYIPYFGHVHHSTSWVPEYAPISPQRPLSTTSPLITLLENPFPSPQRPLTTRPDQAPHSSLKPKSRSFLCSSISQPSCEFSSGSLHVLPLGQESTSWSP